MQGAMPGTSYTLNPLIHITVLRIRLCCLPLANEEMVHREFMLFAQDRTVVCGGADLQPISLSF